MIADYHQRHNGLKWKIGRVARWLRDRWVLAVVTFVAAVALAAWPLLTLYKSLSGEIAWSLTVVGVLAAFAAASDRIADWHVKKEAELEEEAERRATNNTLTSLLDLLESTHDIAFLEGAARTAELKTLRTQLAQNAAIAPVASGIRASCYVLTRDADGWRQLYDPKSRGRVDQASTEFFERDDPDHPIWWMMSARDSDCTIYKEPDEESRVDWASKPYNTFVSVPIQDDGVVFGMLSVNAPQVGDLTEVDRLTVIAMARVMAGTLAMDKGPRNLRSEQSSSDTVGTEQGGADA
jgi:hypothetical protein